MKGIKKVTLEEAVRGLNQDELKQFKKERYKKFIKPLTDMNIKDIEDPRCKKQ
ncbi:hypothetical protein PRVXT_002421 [Proteinivorax tanatarense]|uniref:Uncharacterized protein n=1 Tax=Proteinivorax tanatarense TaxID=1260629 RepID=A0AAU7VKB5_9FIRM